MTALSPLARQTIKHWDSGDDPRIGVSIAAYTRRHFAGGVWRGDSCGCSDDRCIGYHHDEHEECGCLPALLDEWVKGQRADLEAAEIWKAHVAAKDAGDRRAHDAVMVEARAWVARNQGLGVVSFSLDRLSNGRAGITIQTQWSDTVWLVWAAPSALAAGPAVSA